MQTVLFNTLDLYQLDLKYQEWKADEIAAYSPDRSDKEIDCKYGFPTRVWNKNKEPWPVFLSVST